MQDIIAQLIQLIENIKINLPYLLALIGTLWGVHILNAALGYRLNYFGIYPRNIRGLPGILLSPFLHGDFEHLFFNSIPFFILAALILTNGLAFFITATVCISLLSGALTWLFARKAIHVGASDVLIGYWGFLMMNAFTQGGLMAIILAFVCLYYFGSFFLSIVPGEESSSWDGHLFGLIAGITVSYIMPLL